LKVVKSAMNTSTDQLYETKKRSRIDEKSIPAAIRSENKRNKLTHHNVNHNDSAVEKTGAKKKNISIIRALLQTEDVQQAMRHKFAKRLNCIKGLELGRLRVCCAKDRAGTYCRWATTKCPYHQRAPIIPPKYIRNQMIHTIKRQLISEGWTFVNNDDSDENSDNDLMSLDKPIYIGVDQARINLSKPVDLFSKQYFKIFLMDKKPLQLPCKSHVPRKFQIAIQKLMGVIYNRYLDILRNLTIGTHVQECLYLPCLYKPCKCTQMPGKCKEDYRFINIKRAMEKFKLKNVRLRRGQIINIFRRSDNILYKNKSIFKHPDKKLILNGPLPRQSTGEAIQYDLASDPENILLTCKQAFHAHELIFEVQLFDETIEFWSLAYAYAGANRLHINPLGSKMIGITFGEEQSPARVLKTLVVNTQEPTKSASKIYYVVYEEKRQSVYYLDELELCRRVLSTPHANCTCPMYNHLNMLAHKRKVNIKHQYRGMKLEGVARLKLFMHKDFPSSVFVNGVYGRYHGVNLEVRLMDVNTNKLYLNGQSEMIPGMATLMYADTLKKVNLRPGDAGLEIIDDRSQPGVLPSMLVFFGGVMKIRLRITSLSSDHDNRNFCIRFKIDPRWKNYCTNINIDSGKWPSVFTTPITVQDAPLTPIINQAKYLIDYEASNMYFTEMITQLKDTIVTSETLALEEGITDEKVDSNSIGDNDKNVNVSSNSADKMDNYDTLNLESTKQILLRDINLYHERIVSKELYDEFGFDFFVQYVEQNRSISTSNNNIHGVKSLVANGTSDSPTGVVTGDGEPVVNLIKDACSQNSSKSIYSGDTAITNNAVEKTDGFTTTTTTTTSSNINDGYTTSNSNNNSNNNIKKINEDDDYSNEIAIANNNCGIIMNNNNKHTREHDYQETGQERLSLEKYEESFMKQPSIKRGIFEDGSVPNETDSDFEFVDIEDLFDDEENYLVGKHIEIYSQSTKSWNTAYVLRYVRGFHHIVYYHGLSEWIDMSKTKFHVRSSMVCKFCGEVFRNVEHYKIHINDKCEVRKTRLLNGFEATHSIANNDKNSNEIQRHRDLTVASYMDQTLLKHTGAAIQKYTNLLAKERSRTSRMIDKYKFWKKKYKMLKLKLEEKNINVNEVPVEKIEHFGSSVIGSSNMER
jgi:hypothetical protein